MSGELWKHYPSAEGQPLEVSDELRDEVKRHLQGEHAAADTNIESQDPELDAMLAVEAVLKLVDRVCENVVALPAEGRLSVATYLEAAAGTLRNMTDEEAAEMYKLYKPAQEETEE